MVSGWLRSETCFDVVHRVPGDSHHAPCNRSLRPLIPSKQTLGVSVKMSTLLFRGHLIRWQMSSEKGAARNIEATPQDCEISRQWPSPPYALLPPLRSQCRRAFPLPIVARADLTSIANWIFENPVVCRGNSAILRTLPRIKNPTIPRSDSAAVREVAFAALAIGATPRIAKLPPLTGIRNVRRMNPAVDSSRHQSLPATAGSRRHAPRPAQSEHFGNMEASSDAFRKFRQPFHH